MSSSITAIVLDGHPAAFSGTTRDHDPSVDRTQNLPPIPLWTCMVDGTLEFCRIGWETASNQLPEITVIAAGKQPQYLISAGQAGQVDTLVEQLKEVQPRQTTPVDRIQNALISFFEIAQTARYRTLRIVLMLLDKGSGTRYSYSNNEGSEARDIRAMLYDSFKESTSFDSIHVDVLRIFPRTDNLPPNVENNTFAPSATLSVYNIPNHMDALKSAMRNLAQLYYNVDILRITNIPMNVRRQDSSTAMTQTVELYAQCTESCKARHHIHMQAQNDTRMPIHDPRYLRSKVINLVYVKRNKRVVHDMRWCACRHSVTVLVDDGPTKAYLGTIRQGSVSYLMDPENIKANKEWTHILISDHDKVYLHVFDHQLEHKLEEESQTLVAKSKVKTEYSMMGALSSYPLITPDKVQEFTQTFIVPNMYPDILSDLPPTQKFKAFKYSSESPLLSVLSKNIQTTENIELTTRWLTCFRDCMGTDKFPVTLEDNRPISDFAAEVCNGSPLHSGFGLLPTLNLPLSASLNKIKNAVFSKDRSLIRPTIGEVDMMVSQLSAVAVGKSSKMISNFKMLKEDSRLMAKRLLIALYLVGKRFMDNAGGKKCQVCKHILKAINEKKIEQPLKEEERAFPNEISSKEASSSIEAAWNQAKKFEGMTVREQEDSRYSLGTGIANVPSVKHEEFMAPMQSPRPRRGGGGGGIRGGRGGRGRGNSNFGPRDIRDVSVNPNFMRNDGGDIVVPQKRQSEGPPAVPYLLAELAESIEAGTVEMPDYLTRRGKQQQQQQKNQFGPPGSFLDLYWTVDKQLREGKQGDDDGKVLAYRNNKWQRIKKEFDGRMEQQHSVTRGS